MRKVVSRTFSRLVNSVRAHSHTGSRLNTGLASLGASASLHPAAGEAHRCISGDSTACNPHSQNVLGRPPESVPRRTCILSPAHGMSLHQQRSFASSGSDDTDESQQAKPPRPSGIDQAAPSEQEGGSVGQTPQHSSAADSDVEHLTDMAASADDSLLPESQSAHSEAEPGRTDPWALTDERRQAERMLLAPPSGEPLYPGKRGSLAWEPFSDDNMYNEMTVCPRHCLEACMQ